MSEDYDIYEGESVLWLKFEGRDLDKKTLPIYELGTTFMAIQQIINKAYLFQEKRLGKGSQTTWQDRQSLALQITDHKKSSDVYGLGSFLSNPYVTNIIGGLISIALFELGKYALKHISIHGQRDDQSSNSLGTSIFTGAIYNQVTVVVDRIDNIGGVDKIIFSQSKGFDSSNVTFDKSVSKYVRSLRNKPVLGEVEHIEGRLLKLDIQKYIAVIQRRPRDYVNVHLTPEDFNTIRYRADTDNIVSFTGNPIYILGKETSKFSEFSAISIKEIRANTE